MDARGATKLLPVALAVAAGVPAVALRLGILRLDGLLATGIYAAGIAAGAFVVSWAVELLRLDIGGALAIAALAVVTVAPEYSVEAVYAWKAGHDPGRYAALALANMTGSNRLLIGLGWPLIVGLAWARKRSRPAATRAGRAPRRVDLPRQRSVEVAFLGVASVYALTLPLRTRLGVADALVLATVYVVYVARIRNLGGEEAELVGPSAVIARLPPWARRTVVGAMFAFAGAVLVASAEPFAEGVVRVGEALGLSRFLAVRWLAPLASETPEIVLSSVLVWRMQAPTALAALVSTKLNQWTLLIASIPVLFAVSRGALAGLPLDAVQREALFITSAQSLYGLSLLVDHDLTLGDGGALLALFAVDFATSMTVPPGWRSASRLALGAVYLVLAAGVLVKNRAGGVRTLRQGFVDRLAGAEG